MTLRTEAWCAKFAKPAIEAAEAESPGRRGAETLARLATFLLGGGDEEGSLFTEFSRHLLNHVCQKFQLRKVESGKDLFVEGDIPQELFVVASGSVVVFQEDSDDTATDKQAEKASSSQFLPVDEAIQLEGLPPLRPIGTSGRPPDAEVIPDSSRTVGESSRGLLQGNARQTNLAEVFANGMVAAAGRSTNNLGGGRPDGSGSGAAKFAARGTRIAEVVARQFSTSGRKTFNHAKTAPPGVVDSEEANLPSPEKQKDPQPARHRAGPKRTFQLTHRLHWPMADMLTMLSTLPAASSPRQPRRDPEHQLSSFQKSWHTFDNSVSSRVGVKTKTENKKHIESETKTEGKTHMEGKIEIKVRAESRPGAAAAATAADATAAACLPAEPSKAPAKKARIVPSTAVEIGPGSILGASNCISGEAYQWSAQVASSCILFVFAVETLQGFVQQELAARGLKRESAILQCLGPLRNLEREKTHKLSRCFKTINHRRGEVLCWEGEVRSTQYDRLDLLVKGQARLVAETAHSAGQPPAGQKSSSLKKIGAMRDVGVLLEGQLINATSQLLESSEPFTVIADSAEAVVLTVSRAELVRIAGAPMMEQLQVAAQKVSEWRAKAIDKMEVRVDGDLKQKSEAAAEYGGLPDHCVHGVDEYYFRWPQRPPGGPGQDASLLTDDVQFCRKPNPLAVPCPLVHEALVPQVKGLVKMFHSPSQDKLSRNDSASEFWDAASSSVLGSVAQDCDDWGFRELTPMAAQLEKREQHNQAMMPWHIERLAVRGDRSDIFQVHPLEPFTTSACGWIPSQTQAPRLLVPPDSSLNLSLPVVETGYGVQAVDIAASFNVLDPLLPSSSSSDLGQVQLEARAHDVIRPGPLARAPHEARRYGPSPRKVVPHMPDISSTPSGPGHGRRQAVAVPNAAEELARHPLLMNTERQLQRLCPVKAREDTELDSFVGPLHVHSIDRFLDRTPRGGGSSARKQRPVQVR